MLDRLRRKKPCHLVSGITVDDLLPGQTGIVRKVHADDVIRQRLMDLGIIEGVQIQMVRAAPFGDPIQIMVLNTHIALRRNEARTLVIDIVGEPPCVRRKRHHRRFGWKSKFR